MLKLFSRAFITAMVFSALACIAGCGKDTNAKGEVIRENAPGWAEALVTPYPLGKPFVLDGCKVQMYRVAIATTRFTGLNDVTLSTVDCPTATASSTAQGCGNNCRIDMLKVAPKLNGDAPAKAPHA